MAAAVDGDELAGGVDLMHGFAHGYGLLKVDLIVFVAVNAEEGRHSVVDGGDGGEGVERSEAGGVELIDAEEMDAAAVCGVTVDGSHIESFGMIATKLGELAVVDGAVKIDDGGD